MIVVDSSAVVDALTAVDGSDDIRGTLAVEDLHCPGLLDDEVVSGVRGLVLGGQLGLGRAHDVLADYADLALTRWAAAGALRLRAFDLRDRVSAYDAAYVVLAEALACPLLTRDRRLARAVEPLVDVLVQ
jgi:predicted nucleic acid-binding protein